MEANHFRFGNWINEQGLELQVGLITSMLFKNTEPIPLTEKWLFEFGASMVNRNIIYSRFKLIWKDDYKYWYVVDKLSLTYITKIEFVHEFQNFIFVMDGKEVVRNEA